MQTLIIMHENTPVVSHRIIAENTGNEQRAIVQLIANYKEKFEMENDLGLF